MSSLTHRRANTEPSRGRRAPVEITVPKNGKIIFLYGPEPASPTDPAAWRTAIRDMGGRMATETELDAVGL